VQQNYRGRLIKDRVKSAMKFSDDNHSKMEKDQVSSSKDDDVTARGVVRGKIRKRDLFKFPEMKRAKEFKPFVSPVTATSVGRVSGYISMCNVVSSVFGTADLAAKQVILLIFCCLCPIADSLNLSEQSLAPSILENKGSSAFRRTTRNFIKTGAMFGLFMTGIGGCTPAISETTDVMVVAKVKDVVPLFMAWYVLLKGFYLGQKICLSLEDSMAYTLVYAPCKESISCRSQKPSFTLRMENVLRLPACEMCNLAFLVTRKEIHSEILTDSIGSKIVGDSDDTAGHSKISADETTVREGINFDDSREVVLN